LAVGMLGSSDYRLYITGNAATPRNLAQRIAAQSEDSHNMHHRPIWKRNRNHGHRA
jgi:hypothetical protein